jgi:hypothetical protein
VTIGQCSFEAETADVTIGDVSRWTEFGADIRDHYIAAGLLLILLTSDTTMLGVCYSLSGELCLYQERNQVCSIIKDAIENMCTSVWKYTFHCVQLSEN